MNMQYSGPDAKSKRSLRRRTWAKTLTWRITATLDTFVISYLVTGSAAWAGSIAGVEVVTKVGFYYLHERAWERTSWGLGDIR